MSCFGFAVTTLPVSGRGDGGALRACGRSVRRARTEHARIAADEDVPGRVFAVGCQTPLMEDVEAERKPLYSTVVGRRR